MFRFACFPALALVVCCCTVALRAEETVSIDPAKAAQLRRLEPLTAEKLDVFVESGQLTAEQAAYVKRHIGPDGQLALPAEAIAPENKIPAEEPRERAPKPPAGPYADFNYKLDSREQERLREKIRDFRHGSHSSLGRELRKFTPQVNALLAGAYTEAIDLPVKIDLWEEVAGPENPDAAIGLFETHRVAYEVAKPVLIPYFKDVGGVLVRRVQRDPDALADRKVYSSRELRDMIEKIEGLIARCSGPSAAIFLMNVYAQRYDEGEAPMRDCKRDRHRLVEACGCNPKKFDEDERDTWSSRLSQRERAIIADKLIPWLSDRKNDNRRQIARNGLMICLPRPHPDWDSGHHEWDRWWEENKERLMAEK